MSKSLELSPAHKDRYRPERLITDGMNRTLARMDSILLGEEVQVSTPGTFPEHINIRASNARNGKTVQIIEVPVLTASRGETLPVIGVNYHALAHLMVKSLWSYRLDLTISGRDTPTPHLSREAHHTLFRALDCARVERVMISMFPSTMYYFASLAYSRVSEILTKTHSSSPVPGLVAAYVFLSMRPYVAGRMRREILAKIKHRTPNLPWFDQDFTSAAMTYVGAPLASLSPAERQQIMTDTMIAYQAIYSRTDRAGDLLSDAFRPSTRDGGLIPLCADTSKPEALDPMGAEEEKAMQEKAEATQGDGQQDADADNDDQGDGDGGDPYESAAGTLRDLRDQAQQAQDDLSTEAREDAATNQEIEGLEEDASGASTFSQNTHEPTSLPIDLEMRSLSRRLAREFGKIMENADPGFMTHESSGRVNMMRNMRGIDDYDTAFDLWDEGNHLASSIELVMGMDISASMGRATHDVAKATWAISRAVESLGDAATVTTFAFNIRGYLMKPTAARTAPDKYLHWSSGGGTVPMDVLVDAHQIIKRSKKAHKIIVLLTDGAWGGDPSTLRDYEAIIGNMQKDGAHVALAYMDTGYGHLTGIHRNTYGVDTYRDITQSGELVTLASSLVRAAMQNRK